MADRRIDVTLGVKADVAQARQQLQSLRADLSNIQSKSLTVDDSGLKKAAESAKQLQIHLQNALNTNTGNIDLSKLDASLKRSNTNIQTLGNNLLQSGAMGQQAFIKLSQSIANAEYPALRLSKTLKSMGTTLMSTIKWQISSSVLHGFMGAVQQAYGYAQDLNDSLNDIRIVTGYNIETMDRFAESANRAAKNLSTSTLDYTKAALIYYQQGLGGKEIEERTQATMKMANVTGQAAKTVSDQLTSIWNNFDDGTKSLEYYADAITALGAATASSTDEIAQGLEKFAAVSETIGLSYEYATAALATVTAETRQSADTVGTAFKTLFSRIQGLSLGETLEDGTDLNKYSKALEVAGINIKNGNDELKNMDTILDEMGNKWNTLNKDQQVALAQTVAGVRQYTQLVALMDNWDTFKVNVEVATGSEGTLNEQQKIYEESWEASSKRVRASMEELWSNMLDDDFFIGLNDGLASVTKGLNDIIEGFGGIGNVIGSVAAIFIGVFANKIGPMFANIKNSVLTMFLGTGKQIQTITKQTQEMISSNLNKNNFNVLEKQQLENSQNLAGARAKLALVTRELSEAERNQAELDLQIISNQQQETEAIAKQIQKLEEKKQVLLSMNETQMADSGSAIYAQQRGQIRQYENQIDNSTLDPSSEGFGALITNQQNYSEAAGQLNQVLEQQVQKMAAVYVETKKIEGSNPEVAAKEQKSAVDDLIQSLVGYVAQYDKVNASNWDKARTGLLSFRSVLAGIPGDTTKVRAAINKAFRATSVNQFKKGIAEIQKELVALGLEGEDLERILVSINPNFGGKIVKTTKEAMAATEELRRKQEALNKAYANFHPEHTMTGIERLGKIAGIAGSISMVTTSFKNLWNAIAMDVDMSPMERITTILMSFSMLIPGITNAWNSARQVALSFSMVQERVNTAQAASLALHKSKITALFAEKTGEAGLQALKQAGIILDNTDQANDVKDIALEAIKNKQMDEAILKEALMNKGLTEEAATETAATIATWAHKAAQDGLNSSFMATLGPILLIVAAVALLTAGIFVLVNVISNWYNADKIAAEQAAKNVENLTKRYEELTEEVNKFKEAVSNYDDAVAALEELEKGTQEYNEALEKANENARNLIETYGLYNDYTIQDGVIKIDDAALKEAEADFEKRLSSVENSLHQAKIDSHNAEMEYMYTQFRREGMEQFSNEDLKKITETFNEFDDVINSETDLLNKLYSEGILYADVVIENKAQFENLSNTAKKTADAIAGLEREITKNTTEEVFGDEILKIATNKETGIVDQALATTLTEIMTNSVQNANYEDERTSRLNNAYESLEGYKSGAYFSNADIEDYWNSNIAGGEELKELAKSMGITSMDDRNTYRLYMAQQGWKLDEINRMDFDNQNGRVVVKLDGEEIFSGEDKYVRELLAKDAAFKAITKDIEKRVENDDKNQAVLEATKKLVEDTAQLQKDFGIDTNEVLNLLVNKGNYDLDFAQGLTMEQASKIQGMTNDEILNLLNITPDALEGLGLDGAAVAQKVIAEGEEAKDLMERIMASGNIELSTLFQENAEVFSDLTVSQAKEYQQIIMAAYRENGIEGAKRLAEIIKEIGIDKFLEFSDATSEIDWSTAGIDDVKDALAEAGIESKYTIDEIVNLSNGMKETADSAAIFANQLGLINELLDENLMQGDTITQEQYAELGENLQGYFVQMLDGTYKLVEGAYEFNQALKREKSTAFTAQVRQAQREGYLAELLGSLSHIAWDTMATNTFIDSQGNIITAAPRETPAWNLFERKVHVKDKDGNVIKTFDNSEINDFSIGKQYSLTSDSASASSFTDVLANEVINNLQDGAYSLNATQYTIYNPETGKYETTFDPLKQYQSWEGAYNYNGKTYNSAEALIKAPDSLPKSGGYPVSSTGLLWSKAIGSNKYYGHGAGVSTSEGITANELVEKFGATKKYNYFTPAFKNRFIEAVDSNVNPYYDFLLESEYIYNPKEVANAFLALQEWGNVEFDNSIFDTGLTDEIETIWGELTEIIDAAEGSFENLTFTADQLVAISKSYELYGETKLKEWYEENKDVLKQMDRQRQAWALQSNSTEELNKALEEGQINSTHYLNAFETVQAQEMEIDSEELILYTDHIMKLASLNDEFSKKDKISNNLANNAKAAEDVAKATLRANEGIQNIKDNIETWTEVLKPANRETAAYAKANKGLREALADVLGVSEGALQDSFLENVENLNLMKQAAEGSEEALKKLQRRAFENIVLKILIDNEFGEVEYNSLLTKWNELFEAFNDKTIEVGVDLDLSNFEVGGKKLGEFYTQLVRDSKLTVDQVNEVFGGMGVKPVYKTQEVPADTKVPKYTVETTTTREIIEGTPDNPIKWKDIVTTEQVESSSVTLPGTLTVGSISTDGTEPEIKGEYKQRPPVTSNSSSQIHTSSTTSGISAVSGGTSPTSTPAFKPQSIGTPRISPIAASGIAAVSGDTSLTGSEEETNPTVYFESGALGNRSYIMGDDGNWWFKNENNQWEKYVGETLNDYIDDDNDGIPDIEGFEKIWSSSLLDLDLGDEDNGGGKDNKPEDYTDQKKNLDDIIERYEYIDNILEDIERNISRASKEADRLWGSNRIKALQNMNKELKEQQKALSIKQTEIEANLAKDEQAALEAGFVIEDGHIVNKNEVLGQAVDRWNAIIDELNSKGTKEEQDAFKETEEYKNAEKEIDTLQEIYDTYETSKDELANILEEQTDVLYAIQDNNLDILNHAYDSIKTTFDMQQQYYEIIKGDLGDGYKEIRSNLEQYINGLSKIGATFEAQGQANEGYLARAEEAFKAGDISQAGFIEALSSSLSGDADLVSSIDSWLEEIFAIYNSVVNSGIERINEEFENFEKLNETAEHYKNILGLIGEEENYIAQNAILASQYQIEEDKLTSSQATLKSLRAEKENLQAQIDRVDLTKAMKLQLEEDMKIVDDAIKEEESKIQASTEAMFENAQQQLDNNLAIAKEKLSKAFAGEDYTNLDSMTAQFNRQSEMQELFLTKTNQAYETARLIRQAQLEIDKTDNELSKQKYNNYIKEVESLQDQAEISQTELDIAQARYDLLQAQIALEDAKNAKSMVRLTRNAEGNWGYMYTADENKVAEAEQNVADKENALYNIGLETANEYASKKSEILNSMYEELSEIEEKAATGFYKTEEEKDAEILRIKEHYYKLYEEFDRRYNIGRNTMLTESAEDEQYTLGETLISVEEFKKGTEQYIEDANIALKSWGDTVKDIAKKTNLDFIAIGDGIGGITLAIEGKNGLVEAMKGINKAAEEVKKTLIGVDGKGGILNEIITTISEALIKMTNFNVTVQQAETVRENAVTRIGETASKAATQRGNIDFKSLKFEDPDKPADQGETKPSQKPAEEPPPPVEEPEVYLTPREEYIANNPGRFDPNGGYNEDWVKNQPKDFLYSPVDGSYVFGQINIASANKGKIAKNETNLTFPGQGWGHNPQGTREFGEWVYLNNAQIKNGQGTIERYTGWVRVIQSTTNTWAEVGFPWGNPKNSETWSITRENAKFDTGGYTGAWGPEGKLATLHEKEIVLNKYDTENFLQAIEMVRSIADFIDQNASVSALGLLGYGEIGAPRTPADEILQQEVTIHADFPNVQDHNEIEMALQNLINTASQYANRK